jgi:hypothetical protein
LEFSFFLNLTAQRNFPQRRKAFSILTLRKTGTVLFKKLASFFTIFFISKLGFHIGGCILVAKIWETVDSTASNFRKTLHGFMKIVGMKLENIAYEI